MMWISQEDLSFFVHTLSMTLQITTDSSKWGQIRIISDCDQKVSVLWVGFLCRERTNEGKTLDTRKSQGCAYECQYFSNQSLAFKSRIHVTPIVCIRCLSIPISALLLKK